MKFLNALSVILPVALFNAKKAFAIDNFFEQGVRPEFFEITDFKIPKFTISMPEEIYVNFFLARQCILDANPSTLVRNDDCYTAPWVDLNDMMKKIVENQYIDVKALKNDPKDNEFVEKVINNTQEINITEFENLLKKYSNITLEQIFSKPYNLVKINPASDFVVTDAAVTYQLEDDIQTFDKIKFSIGGRSTRYYSKLGYNLNIKGGKDLHGVKQIRFRSETVDPSFIRDKLSYDLHNKIKLPTLCANYAQLYFNDHYMGLFVVRDAFKSNWIEQQFGEKSTKHLYSCDGADGNSDFFNCVNDETELVDDDWREFIRKLEQSKTREDLEKFFDVDTYIRWQVARYIFGSWDHVTKSHNNVVYMFHDTTTHIDKWIPLLYDFDLNFGVRAHYDLKATFDEEIVDPTNPLYEILDLNERNPEVLKIMEDYLRIALNPEMVFTRIDELKSLIDDYVYEDRTPDANGKRPGRVARMETYMEDIYDYESFAVNSEFTHVDVLQTTEKGEMYGTTAIGVKEFILGRFQFACSHYHLDCSYADDFLNSPYIKTRKTGVYNLVAKDKGCNGTRQTCCVITDEIVSKDSLGYWGVQGGDWCLFDQKVTYKPGECWAEAEGFPCCSNKLTELYKYYDGKPWGIENGDWCGMTDYQLCPAKSDSVPCCSSCEVVSTNVVGSWGFENGQKCSIKYSCLKEQQQ